MEISVKTFEQLTNIELYKILQLRTEVFVVEQDCVYQDIDGKDDKGLHIIGTKEGEIVAYTRCFKPGDYFKEASIGRVVVHKDFRKDGLGYELMSKSVEQVEGLYDTKTIKIGAQRYLRKFYESLGFISTDEFYMEDGIPHLYMIKG